MVVSLYMRTPGYRPRDWEKRGAGTHVIAIRRERGRRGHAYNGGRSKGPAGDAAAPMDSRPRQTNTRRAQCRGWRLSGNHPLGAGRDAAYRTIRSEEHTSELPSLMRNSYAVFCLKKKKFNRCTR